MTLHDVCIVGAGAAGAALANICVARGMNVVLFERTDPLKPCLKAEQVSAECVDLLRTAGFSRVTEVTTPIHWAGTWLGSVGLGPTRLERPDHTFEYHRLVNHLRDNLHPGVHRYFGEVVEAVARSARGVSVRTRSGAEIEARIVVVATGDSPGFTGGAGKSTVPEAPFATAVAAWDIEGTLPRVWGRPVDRVIFHRPTPEGVGYVTVFRRGDVLRANAFMTGDAGSRMKDELRKRPLECVAAGNAAWERVTSGWRASSDVAYRMTRIGRSGLDGAAPFVTIGDAAHVVDPSGGEGTELALQEAWILGNRYIPEWLRQPELPTDASSSFYADVERSRMVTRLFRLGVNIHALYAESGTRGHAMRAQFAAQECARAARHWLRDRLTSR